MEGDRYTCTKTNLVHELRTTVRKQKSPINCPNIVIRCITLFLSLCLLVRVSASSSDLSWLNRVEEYCRFRVFRLALTLWLSCVGSRDSCISSALLRDSTSFWYDILTFIEFLKSIFVDISSVAKSSRLRQRILVGLSKDTSPARYGFVKST
jgi:hypothetical protein